MGWAAFAITLIVAIGLGLALKRRTDAELAALAEQASAEVTHIKTEAQGRVRRLEREADRTQNQARDALLLDVLPLLDSLDLAREQMADPEVRRGLEIVISEFERALDRHGVQPVAPQPGDPFDPELHEAVETFESADHVPGTIGRRHRTGWRSVDRVLRPALVGVAKAPDAAHGAAEQPAVEVASASSE